MKVLYRDKEIAFTLVKTRFGEKPLLQYPHAAGILPVEKLKSRKQYLWLVEQYRLGSGAKSWEIPAGKKKNNESILQCAKRELAEETGLIASDYRMILDNIALSNSVSDERATIFVARGLTQAEASPEETEVLQLRRLPLREAIAMVRRGEITDSISVIALLVLALDDQ